MFKVGTFLAHQPPDGGKAKKLFTNFWQSSRDLFEGVVRVVRSRPKVFKVTVDPRAICIASRPVLQAATKPNNLQTFLKSWENVVNGYLSRNVSNGLASRVQKAGIFQGLVVDAARSNVRYNGLAQKIVRYGFVGIGFAAGTQMNAFEDSGTDEVYSKIRDMFATGKEMDVSSIGNGDVVVGMEGIEFGSVIGGCWNSTVFKARLNMLELHNFTEGGAEDQPREIQLLSSADHNLIVAEDCVSVQLVEATNEDAMEDAEISFEEALIQTKMTVCEQQEELAEIRRVLNEQALKLKSYLGHETISPPLHPFEIFCEETAEGFTLICSDPDEVVSLEDVMTSVAGAEELDADESDVRSFLSNLSATFDELEAALNFAEQQHLELVNLYQIFHAQNTTLRCLMAQENVDEGRPRTKMKCEESCDASEDIHELADVNHFPVRKKSLELRFDDDAMYTISVKVCPMTNCSVDHVRRMLVKELLPATSGTLKIGEQLNVWHVPAHFNIVELYGGCVVPLSDIDALSLHMTSGLQHPVARSVIQSGSALCVVMKRYEFTLAEFLASHSPGILESSLLLLQLLEGVVHLAANDVCHRNLNADNIFVEKTPNGLHLVISDFGQSVCGDGLFGLHVPYVTQETYKGGCLLAPEIDNAETFSFLNYRKSDVWTAGAIAYEIFGAENPFCGLLGLSTAAYREKDIPDLPSYVPRYLNSLVKSMLKRNPNERPDSVRVANALHVLLWAPKEWIGSLQSGGAMPSNLEIRRWLVQLGATVRCSSQLEKDEVPIVNTLQKMFLARIDIRFMVDAVQMLWGKCGM